MTASAHLVAPTCQLEREFGSLMKRLEDRDRMAGATGVPVVQRTAMNNRFLRREDEEEANTSNLSKAAREQLDEKKQRELERKLREQQLDSYVTLKHSQLAEQWTSKAEPLPTGKEFLYISPGSKVDVPAPLSGVASTSPVDVTGRARRASTSSLDFLGEVEDEVEKKVTITAQKVKSTESVTALQKVRATNSRHNEILKEHNKSWEALRQKYAQGEGTDMGGIDISEVAADDAEIKAVEAQSNWPQIRKIVRSANGAPGTLSDEDDGTESDEGNDNSPQAIEKQIRKRKAKLAQQFALGVGGDDRRGQLLQKQLDDALKTIEQMRDQHDRHMAELRLRLKLEMQAYEAAHGDKLAALQEELQRSEEQLKALRTQHSTAVTDYERRLGDVIIKFEQEQSRRESQEKRYEQQLADLDSDLESTRSALRTLEKESRKEISDLKDTLEMERREKAAFMLKAEDLARRLEHEIRERTAVEATLRESESKREALTTEIRDVREQQVETVKMLTTARRESAILLEGRANFEQALEDRYQGQIDQLRHSGQELQKNFDQVFSEKTYLAEQVEILNQQLREVDAQRRQMKSILAELQKTQKLLTSTTAENQGLKQRRVELICQNAILRATTLRLSRTTLLHKRILDLEEQNEWLVAKVTALSKRKIKDQPNGVGAGWWYQEPDGTVDPMAQRIKCLTRGAKDPENAVVFERDASTQVTFSSSEFDPTDTGSSVGGAPQRSLLWRTAEKGVQAPEEDPTAHASAVAQLHRYMANSPAHDSLVAQLERKAELALKQCHDISLRTTPSHSRHEHSTKGTGSEEKLEQSDQQRIQLAGAHAPDPASVASYVKLGHQHYPRPISATSDRSEGPDPLQPAPKTRQQRPTSAVSFRSEASTTANSMGSGPKAKTRPNSALLHSEGRSSSQREESATGTLKIVKVTNPQPVPLPSLSLQGEKRRTVDLHQNPYNAFRQRNQRQREHEKQPLGSPEAGERPTAPGGSSTTSWEPSAVSPAEAFHGFNPYSLHLDEEKGSGPSPSLPLASSSAAPSRNVTTMLGSSSSPATAVVGAPTTALTPDPQTELSSSPQLEATWVPTAYTIGAHKPLRASSTASSSQGPTPGSSAGAPSPTEATTGTVPFTPSVAGPTNPFDGFKPSPGVPVGTWRPKSAKLR